jgi:endonuclease III
MSKKLLIAVLSALLLPGCATKEQTDLKQALVDKFKDDQDLKDYKLDPADVAECVVKEIGSSLPVFGADPRRAKYFEAYARFLSVKSSGEAEKSVAEFQQLFGSAKKAQQAAASVTDHIMTCMGKAIETAGGPLAD